MGQFPASAANSLIEGYCDDFVSLAAILAQTLEQVAMRGIAFESSRPSLERIERGMRELASAIQEMLARAPATTNVASTRHQGKDVAALMVGTDPHKPARIPPRSGPDSPPLPTSPGKGDGSAQAPATATAKAAPHGAAPAPSAAPAPPKHSVAPTAPAANARPAPVGPRRPTSVSTAASPATPRAGRTETLKGTNQSMPLLSVFQFLGRMRKSGTMHVFVDDESLAFEFVNGCIQFTASNRCPTGERLGELLVELGFCTRDTLAPILAKVGVSSADRLGQLVVEQKLVSNGQVLEALEKQVQRRFQRVCRSPAASYEFEEGRRLPGDGRIRIAPFELVFEQTKTGDRT